MNEMNRENVIQKLKSICSLYTDILGTVILFGSYSRGEANGDSDIDLYIEPRDLNMTTSKFWSNKRYKDFKYTLYDSFPCEFDLLSYGGKRDLMNIRKSPLWDQIERDGVFIYDKRSEAI